MSAVLTPGVYPASVTPFAASGEVDVASVARLLAYFEASGCKGVVLAGTNGEGPSLSAVEKRDLLRSAVACRGKLKLVLGVATPSLTEAHWLCSQAGKNGADAVLLMPPSYFRSATDEGVEAFLSSVIEASSVPVVVYNFPQMTGFKLSAETMGRLCSHPNAIGLKDSSGEAENLAAYRNALGDDKVLFVGNETLLLDALQAGWTGTISGAANVVPVWLAKVVDEWVAGRRDQARTSFEVVRPVIETIRKSSQPAANKAVLHALGVIDLADPRLPLLSASPDVVLDLLETRLGVTRSNQGVPVGGVAL